ncbi:MAG: sulfate ABC transporter substrate-binding protein, partial [Kovacikia sp.]
MRNIRPSEKEQIQATVPSLLAKFAWSFQSMQPFQTKGSALLIAAGFGLAMAVPALAASPAAQSVPPISHGQRVSQQPKTVELTLVSFAVTKEAHDKIIPLFQEKWKREHGGQEVRFNRSYGGSGTQARAVVDGLEADVVSLALSLDNYRIQKAGLINPGWEKEVPNDGIVSRSVITFVTRPGNPKGIRTWADLVKPGIKVITANPKTSGGARWNFLGLWGSVSQTGGAEDKAREYVTQVYRNVPVLPK